MKLIFVSLLCIVSVNVSAQKYVSEKSFVSFFSHATIEDIKADNKKASGILNSATTDIVFSIPINQFQFEKSLMQEHFNEKYMESDKFPKSTFQGKFTGFNSTSEGKQEVKATGKLTIHGVTNTIDVPGSIERQGDKLLMKSKFTVKLKDYRIDIPQLLWEKIAEEVEVTIEFTFKPQ